MDLKRIVTVSKGYHFCSHEASAGNNVGYNLSYSPLILFNESLMSGDVGANKPHVRSTL